MDGSSSSRTRRVFVGNIESHLVGLAGPLPSGPADTRERHERRAAAASGLLNYLISQLPKKGKPAAEPEVAAEAAAAAAAEPRMLAILGHGYETGGFDDRQEIPDGITLVVITEHFNTAIMPHTCSAVSLFSDDTAENRVLLQDPYTYRKAISDIIYGDKRQEKDVIHVYRRDLTGTYPTLHISPLADWSKKTTTDEGKNMSYMAAFRSGVYEFPIKPTGLGEFLPMELELQASIKKDTFYKTNSALCPSMLFYSKNKLVTEQLIASLFTGSLYPKVEAANAYIESSSHSVIEFQNKFEITLEKLFTQMGPGIYYYLICRDGHTGITSEFNNSWEFIFPEKERLRTTEGVDDFTIPGTYAYQILYFRGEYAGITDPIEKAMYYLNVLNGTQRISHPGPAVVDPFLLSDANFIRLALLLVSEDPDLLPKGFWLEPSNTTPNRNAFEDSSDWFKKTAGKVSAAQLVRTSSLKAQQRDGPPVASGGSGSGGGASKHTGGARRSRKTRRQSRQNQRKSKLASRKRR